MNNIEIFKSADFGEVRTLTIDNKPYFVGKDVADILGYARYVLGFPKEYLMPCFIGIGKPKLDVPAIKQKDIDVKKRIHWNRW